MNGGNAKETAGLDTASPCSFKLTVKNAVPFLRIERTQKQHSLKLKSCCKKTVAHEMEVSGHG